MASKGNARKIKIAIAGACGRMGQRLIALVAASSDLELVAVFEKKGFKDLKATVASFLPGADNVLVTDNAEEAINKCDILIDFTFPEVTLANLGHVKKYGKKAVIGTTGLSAEQKSVVEKAAKECAVVFSPNMSVGVNLLFKLSGMVASILHEDYDIEIVEAHHKHKKDAPSGTAARLAELVAEGRNVSLAKKGVYGRKGITGERERGSIGVHAIRGGDVVGEHTVSFLADGERVELVHKASSRDAFAKGALVAARYLKNKQRGIYSMQDVLGLS
ncbi:MAG: 4-hydroxy-tetrahydrodipicolinate reductase [Candidatus Omnitrophica bacterium]|nr:4-hydroxy-tetrahydrodipicolinate reductase [Candidatus Omnitrophota bacterium]